MSATESELTDPALLGEVDLARAAAQEEAADEEVGAHVGTHVEGETAVTHLFEADKPGYHGWRWAVTVASGGPDTDVTVSEVVLLPGPVALVAPEWLPWEHRVQAGDLGVGDLMPTAPDDPRLVPAYVESDDPAVEDVAREVGLGRPRVMARPARLDAAARWQHSEFGPRSDMARSAPAHCGTCGFYLPLAGSLRAAFGTCGNEISPADGHVVHAEYGCGAHSEAEVEQVSPVLVANLIYDDAQLDVAPLPQEAPAEPPVAELSVAEAPAPETAVVETPVTETPVAETPAVETPDPVAVEAPAEHVAEATPASSVWTEPVAEAPAEPVQAEEPTPTASVWTEPVTDAPEPDQPAETAPASVWTEPASTEPESPAEPEAPAEPDQATDPAQPEETRPEDPDATPDGTADATPDTSADTNANASTDQPQLFDDEAYQNRRPWVGQRWFDE